MAYSREILAASSNPEALELLYQRARQEQEEAAFRGALQACYEDAPENVLYAAWYYRLRQGRQER